MEKSVSYSYTPYQTGTARPWTNHRATVRYQCALATPGKVITHQDEEFQQGWVLDLSLAGIGLELPRPIPVGTRVLVHIKSATGKQRYELHAGVVRVTTKPTGEFVSGCELMCTLTDDDLDALLD